MKSNEMRYETTILNAIIFTITYIIIGLVIPATINEVLWRPLGDKFSVWLNIITLTIVSIIFFIRLAKITQYKIAIFNNVTLANIALAVVCSTLFFLLLDNFLDPIFDSMFPASAAEYMEMLTALRLSPATTFVRICLFAPITEELLMRGYVLTGLKSKYGPLTALLITTALFAILHFNFVQTLSAIIGGLVIGLLYLKTDSLFCCILTHTLYNSISFFAIISIRT